MSTLKADTIQSTSGGAATLTKQQAVKHFVNYDAPNQTSDSSFNQSSLTDYAAGEFKTFFTNSFNSATDKVHVTSTFNSADDGSNASAARTRGGSNSGLGTLGNNQAIEALSASGVQFFGAEGSTASVDGAQSDFSAIYVLSMGDLA